MCIRDSLWPHLEVSHPPVSVVINISPTDTNEENGSVELWPGTHLIGSTPSPMTTEIEETRRQIIPPIRGNARKGSALIRDVRLWHRGVPNQSSQILHMIAMIHHIEWWCRETMRLLSIAEVNRPFWPVIWITTQFLRMSLLITCFCKRNSGEKCQSF